MASTLPQQTTCCNSCDNQTVTNIPGAAGAAGAAGADGADGIDAFTYTAAAFTQPAVGNTVNVSVVNSDWIALGQPVFVATGGFYTASAIPDSTHVTLNNLGYAGNAAPAAVIASPVKVSPGGLQGTAGSGAGAFMVANKLNELAGVPADQLDARNQLGLGTISTQAANAVAITGGSIAGITDLAVADGGTASSTAAGARTALGCAASGLATASGLTVSATDVLVGRSTAGAGAVEEIACTVYGRQLLDDASVAAQLVTLGRVKVRYGMLGSSTGINMNAAGDATAITISATKYIVRRVIMTNASLNMTTATIGLFGSGGGGAPVVCADQAVPELIDANHYHDLTISGAGADECLTAATLIPRIGTPQGAAATADMYIFGEDLS